GIVEKNGYKHNRIIVVQGENWHGGVIGIVAARMCEKYGRPVIVLSNTEGVSNGSARSVSGFSIYEAIKSCSYLLSKFGGHEMAAGVTLPSSSVDAFRREINEYAANLDRVFPEIKLDCKLSPLALSVDLVEELRAMEPFGVGNPTPIFGIFGLTLEKISPVASGKHLRLTLSRDGASFTAMLFGMTPAAFAFEVGNTVDIAVTLDTNEYNGNISLTVNIKEIRQSLENWDNILIDIDEYESFKSGLDGEYSAIAPTREEVGIVYKEIQKRELSLLKLENILLSKLSPAKTLIAAEALCELRLCSLYEKDGVPTLKLGNQVAKANLADSKILRKISERG
ncbi:MAG: single-stranded-DNA-specific exonuclease RecJ, partial [Clostridia bacterium]|nr:single-stranded-DNA-specific exonuclease RecJ [Clostridia bacterium]